MEYSGKLYGKVGRRHIPLTITSADIDGLIQHCRDELRWAEASKIEVYPDKEELKRLDSLSSAYKYILTEFLKK